MDDIDFRTWTFVYNELQLYHQLNQPGFNMTHSSSEAQLSVSNLFSFKNHVCLVTGGATGIGEMAAQGFVQNGARVFIASRKESELKAVRRATRPSNPSPYL